jgi:hypothetical protein
VGRARRRRHPGQPGHRDPGTQRHVRHIHAPRRQLGRDSGRSERLALRCRLLRVARRPLGRERSARPAGAPRLGAAQGRSLVPGDQRDAPRPRRPSMSWSRSRPTFVTAHGGAANRETRASTT